MVALQLLSVPFMLNKCSKEDFAVNKFCMEAEKCEVKLFHTEPRLPMCQHDTNNTDLTHEEVMLEDRFVVNNLIFK